MTYDNFICVYSMTFDLEECVQIELFIVMDCTGPQLKCKPL